MREATVGWSGGAFDVRAGIGTIVWGRLDEVQPTDVINPLDASKYLLEGRADARLPVTHARVRWFAGEKATVEAVWVPLFTRGRYDVLDEASSPFNLLADAERCTPSPACPPVAQFIRARAGAVAADVARRRPPERDHAAGWTGRSPSTAAFRASAASRPGRSACRPARRRDFIPPVIVFETYPRFTMIGGDAETVRGDWAIRGEMAVTTGDTVVIGTSPIGAEGRSVRAGIGADRKAGAIRLNGTVLVEHRVADAQPQLGIAGGADTNVSLVVGGDRGFARDTRTVRVFGAWNVADSSGFARTIGTWSLRDNLSLGRLGRLVLRRGRRRHLALRRARFPHGVAEDLLLGPACSRSETGGVLSGDAIPEARVYAGSGRGPTTGSGCFMSDATRPPGGTGC